MAIKFPARGEALPYGEPFYWEARYDSERALHGAQHHFEWYCDLSDIWPILETYVGAEQLRDDTARTLARCGVDMAGGSVYRLGPSAREALRRGHSTRPLDRGPWAGALLKGPWTGAL
jgi:hypothetical protein